MSRRMLIACTITLLTGACIPASRCQTPQPASQGAQSAAPDPTLKPNPLDALRKFEPSADEEYRLGTGDEITVDFAGRPEMQAKLVVGPDGRITLPLAGEITLAGLTRSDAAKAIVTALNPYYANLAAQVTVTRYTANRVLVLGAVDHPGLLEFDGVPTLLEAVSRSGLPTVGPDKKPQIPDRCAIYRGNDQVLWVQLKQLIDSGNPLADLRLRRDDVIYVPSNAERFVSVLGQVKNPGAIPLAFNATVASLVASAGGFTDGAGSKPRVEIVDPSTGTKQILTFADVMNPAKSSEIQLKPGEIIFVPQSGFYHATYFLERLNPLVTVATIALYAGAL